MKKLILSILFLLCFFSLSGEKYKIRSAEIHTSGKFKLTTTKPSIVEMKFPIDKKTIFTEESLDSYLTFYKQQLINSRYFEEVSVTYETLFNHEDYEISDDGVFKEIIVIINLKDSNHFLAVPYATFKDDINQTIITPKLKAKDTNFLGTLTPLSFDVNVTISKKKEESKIEFNPGMNIAFDIPFKAGPINLTWVNKYAMNYTFGNNTPEWDAKTGFKIELPLNRVSFILELNQYNYKNLRFTEYKDDFYFSEEAILSVPVSIYQFKNYTYLTYTPTVNYCFNWDFDGINKNNDDLSGPIINFGHSLSNSQINWENNFRNGYSFTISNNWGYNFQRQDWNPSLTISSQLFKSFVVEDRNYLDIVGFCSNLYSFIYFDLSDSYFDHTTSGYGEKLGDHLRGIPNEFYFGNEKPDNTSSAAFILNLDFPINIVRTSFKHDIINFDLQLSPFIDLAVYKDRALPLKTDSAICMGGEALIYPKKWSSFTIRVSLGFDMKAAAAEDNFIKGLLHNKEFFIGLGLAY